MINRIEQGRNASAPLQRVAHAIAGTWNRLKKQRPLTARPESAVSPRAEHGVESREFRDAMGRFATGVTVITTDGSSGPHGMTANAVTSVSLDPPLILVCVGHSTRMAELLIPGRRFAMNTLGEDQEPLSRYFSRTWSDSCPAPDHRFDRHAGAPILCDSISTLVCEVSRRYGSGDHDIVVARVQAIACEDTHRRPLLFYRGSYTSLTEAAPGQAAATHAARGQTVIGWQGIGTDKRPEHHVRMNQSIEPVRSVAR